jgi:ribosomal 50S subunit-associated protein YjgA (DUF615 family)
VPPWYNADELTRRLERIQQLTHALAKVRNDAIEQQALSERIHREILAAKQAVKPSAT